MIAADEPLTDQGTFGPVDVLLVEDDPGDVLITREAFEQHGIATGCTWSAMASRPSSSCAV